MQGIQSAVLVFNRSLELSFLLIVIKAVLSILLLSFCKKEIHTLPIKNLQRNSLQFISPPSLQLTVRVQIFNLSNYISTLVEADITFFGWWLRGFSQHMCTYIWQKIYKKMWQISIHRRPPKFTYERLKSQLLLKKKTIDNWKIIFPYQGILSKKIP